MKTIAPERLVFIDESFCTTSMVRNYGWSPAGERCCANRPGASWRTISLVGAIRLHQRPRLMTHRGPVNARVFMDFVSKTLAPLIRKGDVVIMDNLATHKTVAVRKLIEATGARILYLPPYSPELNPIELWWSKLKAQLRSLALHAEDAILNAVRRLRASLPLSNVAGWFRHCLKDLQRK